MSSSDSKCIASELKVGDHLSTTVYYTVQEVNNGKIVVVDETGATLTISNSIVERESFTAVQFNEEVKASRTELVQALQTAGDEIFKAVFKKKDGTLREMIARRVPGSSDTLFGRTQCLECVAGGAPKKRQIDHRSVEEVTIRNKKMKLK